MSQARMAVGPRPVIVGYDAASCLGLDLEAQWAALVAGESGIGALTRFPLRPDFPVRVAGELAPLPEPPPPYLGPRRMAPWKSPVFASALRVCHRALVHAGIRTDAEGALPDELRPRVAVTFSTAVGGLDAVLAADRRLQERGALPLPYMNPNSCINMVGGVVSMSTGATGPIVTTITACATGATSLAIAALLLGSGQADLAICGAVDHPLVEPIVAGFATMNAAHKRPTDGDDVPPADTSRPFAPGRDGFAISEGAAALVLATPEAARRLGLTPRAELAGFAMTADAHKPVAPRLETVTRCMREALHHAGVAPSDIEVVNAHAASTPTGDAVEAHALADVFAGRVPPVTANKGATGHAMGASSALEVVFALLGAERGVVPPTRGFCADPALPEVPASALPRALAHRLVLKNAFGFGGANTSLVLRSLS